MGAEQTAAAHYTALVTSAKSVEHYTPPEIVEAARATMGGIDYDPASCAEANKIVRARAFTAPPLNGLDVPWDLEGAPTKVFLNPPGGKLHPKTLEPMPENGGPGLSAAAVWWWKLNSEEKERHVERAIFVAFTLNVFQNSQQFGYLPPYAFPFVVPYQRLRFWNERTPIGKGQPQHCNAIVHLPPTVGERITAKERALAIESFADHFAPFGHVRL